MAFETTIISVENNVATLACGTCGNHFKVQYGAPAPRCTKCNSIPTALKSNTGQVYRR
jgi:Zn finger protein HypA/HybF involved in hydrogenase expression